MSPVPRRFINVSVVTGYSRHWAPSRSGETPSPVVLVTRSLKALVSGMRFTVVPCQTYRPKSLTAFLTPLPSRSPSLLSQRVFMSGERGLDF